MKDFAQGQAHDRDKFRESLTKVVRTGDGPIPWRPRKAMGFRVERSAKRASEGEFPCFGIASLKTKILQSANPGKLLRSAQK